MEHEGGAHLGDQNLGYYSVFLQEGWNICFVIFPIVVVKHVAYRKLICGELALCLYNVSYSLLLK